MPELWAVLGIAPQREDLQAFNCRASCSLELCGDRRGRPCLAMLLATVTPTDPGAG